MALKTGSNTYILMLTAIASRASVSYKFVHGSPVGGFRTRLAYGIYYLWLD